MEREESVMAGSVNKVILVGNLGRDAVRIKTVENALKLLFQAM